MRAGARARAIAPGGGNVNQAIRGKPLHEEVAIGVRGVHTAITPNDTQGNKMYEPKHRRILRMCGIRMAALYLRNRGYTVEEAVRLLLK